ncbi:MAG TPA: glycosyltransferase family 39 protein [Myxococcota bacterium]|nr:glycosyltransferase family 39 protein [Myxococcota bacterium]
MPSIPRVVLALALTALAVKLWLAATTFGTNDVESFLRFLREYQGAGAVHLYETDRYFTHPPFVLRFLQAVGAVADGTALSWPFCLRVPAILADFGIVLLLARLLPGANRTALGLVAVAPASIFVSGFHGNTDSVMLFFLLLSLVWIEREDRLLLAGAALGMALNVKVVPLLFAPAIFLWLATGPRRLRYFGAALAVVLLGSLPVLFEAPALVLGKVLGYRSAYGVWGLAHLAKSSPALPEFSAAFKAGGRWVLAAGLVLLSCWMNRRSPRPALYRQIGVLLFAFLAFTSGFSVQYLVWLVPWLVLVPLSAAALYLALSGAFLGLVYTFWAQEHASAPRNDDFLDPEFWRRGLPWHTAYADRSPWWRGSITPFEVATWLSVVLLFVLALRGLRAARIGRGCASSS